MSGPSVAGVGALSGATSRKYTLLLGWQVGILICALLAVWSGYKATNLIWVAAAGVAAIWISTRLALDEYLSLLAYIAMNVIIILQPDRKGPSVIDIAAGLAMVGMIGWWVFRTRLLAWQAFSVSWEHLLLVLFFLWSVFIGVGGMLFSDNTPNDWFREGLIQLPTILIPYLCVRAIQPNTKRVHNFYLFLICIWIIVGITNIVAFRLSVMKAVYFYQTGRMMLDPSSAALLFFATMSFAAIEPKRSRLKWYVLPASLASIGILLSGFRTIWLTCLAMMVVMVFLCQPEERKQLWAFLRRFTATSLFLGIIAFFKFRLMHLIVLGFIGRFTSSTQVATDPSLINRYVEWRTILGFIKASPFVGYGFGGRFWDFDWLRGISYFTGYTHNTILYLLFKSGLIGLALMLLAYGGFLVRGWKIARSKGTDKFTRAVIRVAICYLFSVIPSGMTLNAFGSREGVMWMALCWGAILICDPNIQTLAPQSSKSVTMDSEHMSTSSTS